jgi:hypothetical protein
MNEGIGRRWRSVTTGRRFKVSLFIFTSPVLPQICHWPVRKSHSFRTAIFLRPISERTTAKAGTKCVSTNFPKAENESAPGEVFLWGHRADRKPAVKLSPMKPQLRGAFALQAKNLTYDR